ncbi:MULTISPECIES: metal ABC transporter ATP-binding protein [unclassified Leucobacter]|uniref:metal ABC transporter ATP-binding protein n=1 Tax=unclassified Leucobacter TaxID=2621730 RepID=UPI00165D4ABF|nr:MULTISPECIES: metal ABC transporter ATP-binding protein [unclassified Leucobacter]MBC9926530.1 metal ABC transporter ATP-binding protein [Leucobacter sp. cx-169]
MSQDSPARVAPTGPPAIDIQALSVHYPGGANGTIAALERATLTVQPGRICALVGANGAGKSTLFSAIMGLVTPAHGSVRLFGEPPVVARRAGTLGYVPQSESVDTTFPVSVRDVTLMGRYGQLDFTRRPGRADKAAVADALARVELTDFADRQLGRLSGGQRKRAFLARAIAQEARILLLDEPFAGVDKRSEATITRELRALAASGVTVLVSTHDLQALPGLADEAALILRSVLAHGSPEDVLAPGPLARAFGIDVLAGSERGER